MNFLQWEAANFGKMFSFIKSGESNATLKQRHAGCWIRGIYGGIKGALKAAANGKPRLSVFRSGKNIYAQIIDDAKGATIVSASTLDKEVRGSIQKSSTVEAAGFIGKLIAERAVKSGVSEVIFDRGGYIYHGRVKALAEAAREAGLKF